MEKWEKAAREFQKRLFSDIVNVATLAVREEDHYVLNGQGLHLLLWA